MSISDIIQFGILAVALFGERFWKWFMSPKILINFDGSSERCLRKNIAIIYSNSNSVTEFRHVFRLHIVNNGKTEAKRLRAKVELFNLDKSLADNFEPSVLNFITGKEYVDLAPNEDWYIDFLSQIVSVIEGTPLRVELFDKSPRGILWDRPLQPYIAEVVIHGENIKPVVKYFKFIPNNKEVGSVEEIDFNWQKVRLFD